MRWARCGEDSFETVKRSTPSDSISVANAWRAQKMFESMATRRNT